MEATAIPSLVEEEKKDVNENAFLFCRSMPGYDQPSEFDIEGSPLATRTANECCNLCFKHKGKFLAKCKDDILFSGCVSWVWKVNSESCYLKHKYDMGRAFRCDDCIAYLDDT